MIKFNLLSVSLLTSYHKYITDCVELVGHLQRQIKCLYYSYFVFLYL